jgi:hypothetical protein
MPAVRGGLLALIALLALILFGKPALDGGLISLISLISHLNFANHPPGWSLRSISVYTALLAQKTRVTERIR